MPAGGRFALAGVRLERDATDVSTELPEKPPAGIALFDLDGTLIAWDCQLLFRDFVVRRERWRIVFLPMFLACAPFAWLLGTARMKRVFLAYLWKMEPTKLARYSREFAASLMPQIFPEVRAMLEEERAAGHLLILASASPEFYVREIGRELGFDLSLGTLVEVGPLVPPLVNHKGDAKVVRLKQILPENYWENGLLRNCRGYTDSTADLPMLAVCGAATVVNPGGELAAAAEQNGWLIVQPPRPWRTKAGFAGRALRLLLSC